MSVNIPKISVIMGIYNCADTLAESMDSLLAQTYTDFEIILCDDGSADNTYQIARNYAEKHGNIVLLKNEHNLGLAKTLNICLAHAQGTYIARQDGDDISLPNRFETQLEYLEGNPEFAFVSCAVISFNEKGVFATTYRKAFPQKKDFLKINQFVHGSLMIRKSAISDVGGYSESKYVLRIEDYDLFFKLYAKGYIGHNIQIPLYKVRDDYNAYKRRTFQNRINEVYVRYTGFRILKFPVYTYIYCLRPIVSLFLPAPIYMFFHKKTLTQKK